MTNRGYSKVIIEGTVGREPEIRQHPTHGIYAKIYVTTSESSMRINLVWRKLRKNTIRSFCLVNLLMWPAIIFMSGQECTWRPNCVPA